MTSSGIFDRAASVSPELCCSTMTFSACFGKAIFSTYSASQTNPTAAFGLCDVGTSLYKGEKCFDKINKGSEQREGERERERSFRTRLNYFRELALLVVFPCFTELRWCDCGCWSMRAAAVMVEAGPEEGIAAMLWADEIGL